MKSQRKSKVVQNSSANCKNSTSTTNKREAKQPQPRNETRQQDQPPVVNVPPQLQVPPGDPQPQGPIPAIPAQNQIPSPPLQQGLSPHLSWAEKLKQSISPETKLRMLLHHPIPLEKKTQNILITTVRLKLSKKALERPYLAWKSVLKVLTGFEPLYISMYHLGIAEVFWDSRHEETIHRELKARKVLVDPLPSTEKDIPRLAICYLNGYFPMLRRAPLEDLPSHLQASIFDKVEEKLKKFNAQDRRLWMKNIAADRKWFSESEPDDDQVNPPTSPRLPKER